MTVPFLFIICAVVIINNILIHYLYKFSLKLVIFSYIVNVLKFQTLFSFCSQIKCWFSGLEFVNKLVRIANMEGPGQTVSSKAV